MRSATTRPFTKKTWKRALARVKSGSVVSPVTCQAPWDQDRGSIWAASSGVKTAATRSRRLGAAGAVSKVRVGVLRVK